MKNELFCSIKNNNLVFNVLKNGNIKNIKYDNTRINLYENNLFDEPIYKIYLKVENEFTSLFGLNSPSTFNVKDNQIFYKGSFCGIDYKLIFSLLENGWFVDIFIDNKTNKQASIFYTFDVGLCGDNVNELYNSQYIDHRVIDEQNNITILSKQNQGRPLLLETSCLNELENYSIDGFQFYGLEYKLSNIPKAIKENSLPSLNYQYEFALQALKTKDFYENKHFTFYSLIKDNYNIFPPQKTKKEEIINLHNKINLTFLDNLDFINFNPVLNFNNTYYSPKMTNEEIKNLFSEIRNLEEDDKENILSFFSKNNSHIVCQAKELIQERPSGMVYSSNGFKKIDISPFSFTSFMYGIFASHIVYGNTDLNYFTNEGKTHLNVLKSGGLRVFIKIDNDYKILSMPSLYEMRVNGSKWYYKIDDDILEISSFISYDENKLEIEINSKKCKKYDIFITNCVSMCNTEPIINLDKNRVNFKFNQNTFQYSKYPNLTYSYISVNNDLNLVHFEENYPLMIHKINACSNAKILITASENIENNFDFEDIENLENNYYKNLKKSILNLDVKGNYFCDKINDLTVWYTLNALIHYSSPHGLEQCFGGAWGTRDVLQGPCELFLTLNNFDLVKDIILKVYSRQFVHNSDFPQWFMFDSYHSIEADDSHGDIIVWPLKCLAEYIYRTKDSNILKNKIPFYDFSKGQFTSQKYTLLYHLEKQLNQIKNSFIKNTNLSCYGGGDWDDTLQPKDKQKAKNMVSGWTILLTLDSLNVLINALDNTDTSVSSYKKLYSSMLNDFNKYLIKDNIPAGFVSFENDKINYILHPSDKVSNINYRLLPLTRGMIGEVYSKEQVNNYVKIIEDNLLFPDGVRLISSPINYNYGENKMFMRAETASNFGREIGMQYVHAHIRYIEAMSKIGENKKMFDAINIILPINIKDYVKNANIRQSNVYFSSSDGDFLNRFDAIKNFDKLKTQKVKVKAGWRLYSSGAGIYLKQIYQNLFGIKLFKDSILFDPIMKKELDNTIINLVLDNKNLSLKYSVKSDNSTIKYIKIDDMIFNNITHNKYRNGGIKILKNDLKNNSIIEIFVE